jgi:DnaJ-class molecular chaperone
MTPSNHYTLLGVHRRFTEHDLKSSFRQLSSENHPDKHPNDPVKADFIQRVNLAYRCLKDRVARKEYDNMMRITYPKCEVCHGEGVVMRQRGFKHKSLGACDNCKGGGYL